jgi:hypothetical protein
MGWVNEKKGRLGEIGTEFGMENAKEHSPQQH